MIKSRSLQDRPTMGGLDRARWSRRARARERRERLPAAAREKIDHRAI
jgi:hypothetical protein